MKKKLPYVLIVILSIAIIVLAVVTAFRAGILVPPAGDASSESTSTTTAASTAEVSADTIEAQPAEIAEVAEATEAAAEATENAEAVVAADVSDETADERQAFEYDESSAKPIYKGEITQEIFDTFVENLNSNWDFSVRSKEQFIAEHPEIFGDYPKDMDGKLAIPFRGEDQMTSQDEARQNAAKELGLETQPINDALDFPNAELTETDIKAIKAARTNQKVKLEKDLETYEIAIFKDWLSKPVVFESFINLMLEQKIGSDFTLRENWTGPSKFTEAYDKAREDGEGVNHWLRDFEDEGGNHYAFMTTEYVYDYVIPFISFVYTQPFSCEVLASREHYHLVAGDDDALRKAELAKYRENKAAFVWRFLLKDNSVGLMLGDNVRDGRPEILNYTVVKKPSVVKKKTEDTTTTPPTPPGTPPGTPPETPPSTPPTPPPTPPTPPSQKKKPSDGSASQGNADTGGGENDDPGAGTKKPDQGDSPSDKPEDSQYKQGESENKDKTSSGSGPVADNTDNGTPPATTPIVTEESKANDDYVDSSDSSSSQSPGDSSDNNSAISAPPVD